MQWDQQSLEQVHDHGRGWSEADHVERKEVPTPLPRLGVKVEGWADKYNETPEIRTDWSWLMFGFQKIRIIWEFQ
jgi:hypothetical protein